MAREHVIKYYARLVQKGLYKEEDIPEDKRHEVMQLAVTLPLRKDMTTNHALISNDNEE